MSSVIKTFSGLETIATAKPEYNRVYYFSHNWCDPTTWYGDSVYIEENVDTDDNITYQLSYANIIDTYHGKIFGEDFLIDGDGYDYRVHVSVNNVDGYVEHDPHYTDFSDSYDYIIDYENGEITFSYSLQPSDSVFVSYHYENGSTFYARVPENMKLLIDSSEVQFSNDINITDTVKYQVFVYNPYYPSGPLKVPYGNPNVYKTISDFQVEAVKSHPLFPAVGSPGNWRSMEKPLIILNWDYVSGTALRYSQGAEIRIWLEHDIPFEGTYATLTFYGLEEEE